MGSSKLYGAWCVCGVCVCGVCVCGVCVCVVCVCLFRLCHTQKMLMSHGDMSLKRTKGSGKPKVSSSREKPKASRVPRDQWVTLNFILAHLNFTESKKKEECYPNFKNRTEGWIAVTFYFSVFLFSCVVFLFFSSPPPEQLNLTYETCRPPSAAGSIWPDARGHVVTSNYRSTFSKMQQHKSFL